MGGVFEHRLEEFFVQEVREISLLKTDARVMESKINR
jgi:hypothetical protein